MGKGFHLYFCTEKCDLKYCNWKIGLGTIIIATGNGILVKSWHLGFWNSIYTLPLVHRNPCNTCEVLMGHKSDPNPWSSLKNNERETLRNASSIVIHTPEGGEKCEAKFLVLSLEAQLSETKSFKKFTKTWVLRRMGLHSCFTTHYLEIVWMLCLSTFVARNRSFYGTFLNGTSIKSVDQKF